MVVFFTVAFALTWANWIPRALTSAGLRSIEVPEFVALLAGYGPALAAVFAAAYANGRPGLRRLFARLVRWRVGFRWYVVALALPLAIKSAAIGIYLLATGGPVDVGASLQLAPEGSSVWLNALLLFLVFTLGFDGLGEELGWRGFALPRLQARFSAFAASLILGLLWAAWHLPFASTFGTALNGVPLHVLFLFVMGSAVLYTWLFNATAGSVLVAILFHAASNTTANVVATGNPTIYVIEIALVWALALVVARTRGFRPGPAAIDGAADDPTRTVDGRRARRTPA